MCLKLLLFFPQINSFLAFSIELITILDCLCVFFYGQRITKGSVSLYGKTSGWGGCKSNDSATGWWSMNWPIVGRRWLRNQSDSSETRSVGRDVESGQIRKGEEKKNSSPPSSSSSSSFLFVSCFVLPNVMTRHSCGFNPSGLSLSLSLGSFDAEQSARRC